MRSHRRQRDLGVTPPDPGGECLLLGPPPDNSIGVPRPATARMTGAPVDRPQPGRTHETVAYLGYLVAKVNVRSPTFSSCPRKRAPRANAPDTALESRLRGNDGITLMRDA